MWCRPTSFTKYCRVERRQRKFLIYFSRAPRHSRKEERRGSGSTIHTAVFLDHVPATTTRSHICSSWLGFVTCLPRNDFVSFFFRCKDREFKSAKISWHLDRLRGAIARVSRISRGLENTHLAIGTAFRKCVLITHTARKRVGECPRQRPAFPTTLARSGENVRVDFTSVI